MIVALFEDENYENFLPLTYTRPVFECRCGLFTFTERAQKIQPESRMFLFTRDYLVPTLKKRVSLPINETDSIDDDILLINGSLITDNETRQLIQKRLTEDVVITHRDRVALARLSEKTAKKFSNVLRKPLNSLTSSSLMKECKTLESPNLILFNYPWDLIDNNSELIKRDFAELESKEFEGTVNEGAAIYGGEENVYVGKGSFVEANVVLDARNGPIYIGEETDVQAGSRISGPANIGNNTRIVTALIREGCSIGDVCRVGGEVEETIIQGYTNKQHAGFVGHSYIGEWVNIAANTTASDIKNTYGTIKVNVKGKTLDSSRMKVGCFIGDYAKTSIGTKIFAGKKVGIASQMLGLIAEDVPSFTIWAKSLGWDTVELYLESAIETQKRMMTRRNVEQTREDSELMTKLFELTAKDRLAKEVQKGKFKTDFQ